MERKNVYAFLIKKNTFNAELGSKQKTFSNEEDEAQKTRSEMEAAVALKKKSIIKKGFALKDRQTETS